MTTCKRAARRMTKQPGQTATCSCKATGREGLSIDAMEAACSCCHDNGYGASCDPDACDVLRAQIQEATNGRR